MEVVPFLSYDELSFADFLRARGASEGAVEFLRRTLWFGEGIETASALSCLIENFALFHDGGPVQVVDGGNDRLPRAMASALRHRIHYGALVRSIREKDGGVEVVCRATGAGRPSSFSGDHL